MNVPSWVPCPPDPDTGIAGAYRAACQTELRALKPGNVHVFAAGHGMSVDQFLASAEATAPIMAQPGLGVGERIHTAIAATRAAVGCNTNLGIVLLAAPLAQAAQVGGGGTLRDRLRRVLADLTVADAERTFRAIALAAPAGLGRVAGNDVQEPARVTLLAAMREAQPRDRIARQYATDYADMFEIGVPRLRQAMDAGESCEAAAELLYLDLLATAPDSHIIRKHGVDAAERVRRRAFELREDVRTDRAFKLTRRRLGELDRELKYNGLNPGTTADLVVGCLFALWLMQTRCSPQ